MLRIMGEKICLCDVLGWNINLTALQFVVGYVHCCKNDKILLLFFAGKLECIQLRR
jgi:hypothetical protein